MNIEEKIKGYFDLSHQGSPELEAFEQGIRECIRQFTDAKAITSPIPIDELSESFKSPVIPETPQEFGEYTGYLKEHILPHAVNVGNPRYVGHMTSQLPLFFQHIAKLVTAMNQSVVKIETSKVFTLIERQTIGMLHRLVYNFQDSFYRQHIQCRESKLGIITSCGTLANITGLWIARNKELQSSEEFPGLHCEGFINAIKHYGYQDAVIIGSSKMHYSMDKLGSLLGLGAENVIKVKLNAAGAIDINEFKATIRQCQDENRLIVAVVGIAASTETGQIDDLPMMGKIAKEHGIHYHVDAAWGGPILFSDTHSHLLEGIEMADTVTICGHKQLYLPLGISVLLCKDPDIMNHIKATSRYQARAESYDLGKHSPEGSRPAVCAYLHAGLHLLGKKGYGYLIDEGMRKAAYFADLIRNHPAFELIGEPTTNIVNYRYIPEEMRCKMADSSFSDEDHYVINNINEVLQDQQFLIGHTFISRTTLGHSRYGKKIPIVVMRAVISNPMTVETDLQAVLHDQVCTADIVLKQRTMNLSQLLKMLYYQTSSIDRQ